MFEKAWTLQTDGAAPSGTLPNAALAPTFGIFGGRVVDLASGDVLWTAAGAAVGLEGPHVIVVARNADRWTAIERRDGRTGALETAVRVCAV